MSQTAPDPLEDIETWLNEEYDSDHTVDTYLQVARKFHEERGLENLDTESVTRFITEDLADYSESTRNNYRGALPAVSKAARAYGYTDAAVEWDTVPMPTPEDSERRAYPPERVEDLIQAATAKNIKAEAIVRLAYDLALRVSEVSRLKREDIDIEAGTVHVIRSKNGPEHTLPIADSTANALDAYLHSSFNKDSYRRQRRGRGDVFPSTGAINRLFRKVAINAGFDIEYGERFGLHVLRHSRCANLLRAQPYGAGWDVQSVKEFAGHADIATTQEYLELVEDEQDEVMAKMKRDLDAESNVL